jgi:hypothetical protein
MRGDTSAEALAEQESSIGEPLERISRWVAAISH